MYIEKKIVIHWPKSFDDYIGRVKNSKLKYKIGEIRGGYCLKMIDYFMTTKINGNSIFDLGTCAVNKHNMFIRKDINTGLSRKAELRLTIEYYKFVEKIRECYDPTDSIQKIIIKLCNEYINIMEQKRKVSYEYKKRCSV